MKEINKKMLFNPGKIISFQTLIRTTTFNSFCTATLGGGHLPPFSRGQFNRFFHIHNRLIKKVLVLYSILR